MKIRVFADPDEQSIAAAAFFCEASKKSIDTQGRFSVALSGGQTPRLFFSVLASDPYRNSIGWEHVHLFWVDERCVAPDHKESNYRLAADAFLSCVSIPPKNIHRIKGEKGPEKGAGDYEQELRDFFGQSVLPVFDLVVLGIGQDGHIASIFPNSPLLEEKTRLAVPVYERAKGYNRITLIIPVLNNSSRILFLVSGQEKADIVCAIVDDKQKNKYPAGLINPEHGELLMFLDAPAAIRLKNTQIT